MFELVVWISNKKKKSHSTAAHAVIKTNIGPLANGKHGETVSLKKGAVVLQQWNYSSVSGG